MKRPNMRKIKTQINQFYFNDLLFVISFKIARHTDGCIRGKKCDGSVRAPSKLFESLSYKQCLRIDELLCINDECRLRDGMGLRMSRSVTICRANDDVRIVVQIGWMGMASNKSRPSSVIHTSTLIDEKRHRTTRRPTSIAKYSNCPIDLTWGKYSQHTQALTTFDHCACGVVAILRQVNKT